MSDRPRQRVPTRQRAPIRLRAHAPAKINLTLRVLGTRPDGYRELRTIFQSLALHDTLTFTLGARKPAPVDGSGLTLSTNDPACPTDASNLVAKAAALLWNEAGRKGRPPAVHVHIDKRIPAQAGLGGGSSDAAATLRVLPVMWQLAVPTARLSELARELGADVAYFLEGGTVLGVERGDVLFPLIDREASHVVLVLPDFGVSTRDAYAWWQEAADQGDAADTRGAGEWVNDLQPPVAARHPEISRLMRALTRAGSTYAAMSGSGSAVFGLFEQANAAAAAARQLASARRRTMVTRTTTRAAYGKSVRPRG